MNSFHSIWRPRPLDLPDDLQFKWSNLIYIYIRLLRFVQYAHIWSFCRNPAVICAANICRRHLPNPNSPNSTSGAGSDRFRAISGDFGPRKVRLESSGVSGCVRGFRFSEKPREKRPFSHRVRGKWSARWNRSENSVGRKSRKTGRGNWRSFF